VFNIGRWVVTDLGVGWHGPPFGRWVVWALGGTDHLLGVGSCGRWMPPAKALGGVGGPQEAAARCGHKYRSLPWS